MTARRTLTRLLATLMIWTARLAPAAAVGSLLLVFDGNLRWLGLFGLPLLLLALRGGTLGCGPRGCGLGGDRAPGPWPAP
ncbi:MAG: hypothetical protein OEN55_04710 [Alphaproteobacteria bacterium]|nr:hypothetical protein [Alphaproteobacteria bacterium]